MTLHATNTGPFPRSEALVTATRDLDRGRTTPDEVEGLYRKAEEDVVRVEEELGLDRVTAGYLRWQDLFRPVAESWGGFTVGPLTRWFETNTFYRQPVLDRPPERTPGAVFERLPNPLKSHSERGRVILPGPYTFSGLLDNRSGETPEALVHRLGRLLGDEVAELHGRGFSDFQFQEPLLVADPPTGPRAEAVVAAYRSIAQRASGSTTTVWTFFGDAAPVGTLLARLPVDVLGVDLGETEVDEVPPLGEKAALGLGCLDPRTTLAEDPKEVAEAIRSIRDQLHSKEVWIGPGAPLDQLPVEPATKKLRVLAATQRLLTNGGATP